MHPRPMGVADAGRGIAGLCDRDGEWFCRRQECSVGCPGREGRIPQALHAKDVCAFGFRKSAPDSVGFTGSQGPRRALAYHGATLADPFGLGDPLVLLAPAFTGGVVEGLDIHAAAGGGQLPVPVAGDRLCGLVVDGGHRVPFGLPGVKPARAVGGGPGHWQVRCSGPNRICSSRSTVCGSAGFYFSPPSTLVTMLSTSSPYRWCRVGSAPASRNLSGSATGRICWCTPARTAADATVSKSPPMTVWFSRVTASRSVFSSASTVAASKGLMVGVCTTATSTLCACRAFAAARARMVISPLEMNTTSLPGRSTLALQQPQVRVCFGGGELGDGLFDVVRVAGVDDGQVGHSAEDRDVLGGLVAGSVPGGQAGQSAHDVAVQVGFGDVQA